MSILQRSLVAKSGYDCGFEYVTAETGSKLTLASARHSAILEITITESAFDTRITKGPTSLISELQRQFVYDQGRFQCNTIEQLRGFLQRAAGLAQSLPNQAKTNFQAALAVELEKFPDWIKGTEVERVVRQRVGQQTFRAAMLDYWGGACAVTGIAVPEILRASHAKPWSECASDAERLDVYNGFLLSANLDALFDRFLVSFDCDGELLLSEAIADQEVKRLGLNVPLRLRWLAAGHTPYLDYHRAIFTEMAARAE